VVLLASELWPEHVGRRAARPLYLRHLHVVHRFEGVGGQAGASLLQLAPRLGALLEHVSEPDADEGGDDASDAEDGGLSHRPVGYPYCPDEDAL
jgi:hypothetical protein